MTKKQLCKKLRENFLQSRRKSYHPYNYIIWKTGRQWNYLDISDFINVKNDINKICEDYPQIKESNCYFTIISKYFKFNSLDIISKQISFLEKENTKNNNNNNNNKDNKKLSKIVEYLDNSTNSNLNGVNKDGYISDSYTVFKIKPSLQLKIRKINKHHKLCNVNFSKPINEQTSIKQINIDDFNQTTVTTHGRQFKVATIFVGNNKIHFQQKYITFMKVLYENEQNIMLYITNQNHLLITQNNTNIGIICPIVVNERSVK